MTAPVSLRLSDDQDRAYFEAADRAGLPLRTWIKDRCDFGVIWPAVLKPLEEALHTLREEYLQTTRPIDLSWEGWEAFVKENLHRMPRLGEGA